MSILRTQSFPFTLALLVSLISTTFSVSRAEIIDPVLQHSRSSSTNLVNDAVYTLVDHSTLKPSSSLSLPIRTTQGLVIGYQTFGAAKIDITGRDDTPLSSPSQSTISLSDLDSSAVEPSPVITTLLLSSTTLASLPSASSTATPRGASVPLSAVVGGAVGGGLVLIAFIVFIFVTRRRHDPRVEPFPLEPDVEGHQPMAGGHARQMIQHGPPASDVPIIRPPARKQNQHPSAHPLLQSGTKGHALRDYKVSVSATSLHGTAVPETPLGRTFSHNVNCDAASIMSRDSDRRRPRPLPRPPTDKPPPPPVPALPRDLPRCDNSSTARAVAQPTLAVPSHSLASSSALTSPISPLDIDIELADYGYSTGPGTSPPTFSPARRDSQLEPPRSPLRRLPVPPAAVSVSVSVHAQSPSSPRALAAEKLELELEAELEAGESVHWGLHFDEDGRPDSPSVTKMYAELLELQRQVARIREDIPARHFGEAPPDYAESVVGSICV